MFEYDGLPFDFYDHLAKQAADEANHAVRFRFLRGARLLIDELAVVDSDWRNLRERLVKSSTGLPVPVEGDFYPSIRSADLRTRLTWMQIDTEGPGVGAPTTLAESPLVVERPSIRRDLEFVIADEVTHARLGRYWMRELQRDSESLEMDDVRLLRGLLLSETVAQSRGLSLPEFLEAKHSG
jgi:uncharacterized ferritin-like protein (DUF455 family)